jgi:hypothetical protein
VTEIPRCSLQKAAFLGYAGAKEWQEGVGETAEQWVLVP